MDKLGRLHKLDMLDMPDKLDMLDMVRLGDNVENLDRIRNPCSVENHDMQDLKADQTDSCIEDALDTGSDMLDIVGKQGVFCANLTVTQ